jgi:DNA mismatch repair protein MutS
VSILFPDGRDVAEVDVMPDFFPDLSLDQVVQHITASREEYGLGPLFYTPLADVESIMFRQAVFHDLEDKTLVQNLSDFGHGMRAMRQQLKQATQAREPYEREGWFHEAVKTYCAVVAGLAEALDRAALRSEALTTFRRNLHGYREGPAFTALASQTEAMARALEGVRYSLLIRGSTVEVGPAEEADDYSARVQSVFERFQGGVSRYAWVARVRDEGTLNHVEGKIVALVANLCSDVFESLADYCRQHADYLDEGLARFDREIQFYLAHLDFIAGLTSHDLAFCYPEVTDADKDITSVQGFDAALAYKLSSLRTTVVVNSFHLKDPERILMVTGPNQGGKTTFARTFGQLHYLARLGLLVPGTRARLYLSDAIYTHFPREERAEEPTGRLQEELDRMHDMLSRATPRSILVINELFQSTTLDDAVFLSREIVRRLVDKDVLAVMVTFVEDVVNTIPKTVSMVAALEPDSARRTFKIVRWPPRGRSYALHLADQHRLTYDLLKERIRS